MTNEQMNGIVEVDPLVRVPNLRNTHWYCKWNWLLLLQGSAKIRFDYTMHTVQFVHVLYLREYVEVPGHVGCHPQPPGFIVYKSWVPGQNLNQSITQSSELNLIAWSLPLKWWRPILHLLSQSWNFRTMYGCGVGWSDLALFSIFENFRIYDFCW